MIYNLTQKLKKIPLVAKLTIMVIFVLILFFSGLFINEEYLLQYFLMIAFFVMILSFFCYLILGKRYFSSMIHIWLFGSLVYLLIAVFRIYSGGQLSLYIHLNTITNRWLYSLILPIITLGTFSLGLIFMRIISPIEFLSWGRFGFKIVLLLRALQHSIQVFQETKKALMMQNKWPEESNKIISISGTFLVIKYAPLLIRTSFRNIVLFWYPWGWLCFNMLHDNFSKEKRA